MICWKYQLSAFLEDGHVAHLVFGRVFLGLYFECRENLINFMLIAEILPEIVKHSELVRFSQSQLV